MLPRLLLDCYAVLTGLVIGSFLNVLIHRLPRGRSYLLLRGRCRHCWAPISPRYPVVEALTGLLFLACLERFGPTPQAAAAAVFCALLVALAVTDLEQLLLPDGLTFSGMALGLALQPWLPPSAADAVVGLLVGAGGLFLVAELWLWLRGEEGMGLGDAKLLAMVGAFLGWQGVVVAFAIAIASGAVAGLGMLALGRLGWKSRLPFGVFIAAGAMVALFAVGSGALARALEPWLALW